MGHPVLCHRPLFLIKFGRPISSTICKLGCCCCDTIRSFFEIELSRYQVIVIHDSNKSWIHEYFWLKTKLYNGNMVIGICLWSTQICWQYNFERNQGSRFRDWHSSTPKLSARLRDLVRKSPNLPMLLHTMGWAHHQWQDDSERGNCVTIPFSPSMSHMHLAPTATASLSPNRGHTESGAASPKDLAI